MSQPAPNDDLTERQTADEMAQIPYESLLPAEKWLIVSSLLVGFALLGLLLWISATYFPMAAP